MFRSKRALSPVVSAVFLISVMVAAIGITMGVIYPQVQQLTDNMELINAATSVNSLDTEIKSLIANGEGGKVSTALEIGQTGYINTDQTSFSTFYLMRSADGGTPSIIGNEIYFLPHNRFIISQFVDQDVIETNTHQYLTGSGSQSTFFLNETNKAKFPWTILNQSRGSSDMVNTSLSYRGLITPSKVVNYDTARISLVISIQYIVFDFPGSQVRGGHNPGIEVNYHTLNITTTPVVTIPYVDAVETLFILKINTFLEGIITVELPFKHEVPTDGFLDIQLEFVIHHVSLQF